MKEIWHRHHGVYGICSDDQKLLLIHKNGGPYSGRFDLPGGSLEPNESVAEALLREFREETGLVVKIHSNAGFRDFVVPWIRSGYEHTHCHHIALFYKVSYVDGDVTRSPNIDDSLGAEWVDIGLLNQDNSSPLVLEALNWMNTNIISSEVTIYKSWEIKN
ncbi:NUDIX domain-containing protein [Xylanibacillus composti]|uniref:DNA mismatch repair protein MutT n=1 Tax=Xylanibacillus composti TaxID=1572762 RepID=A0A8J4H7H6_9BACL|nr:NUDIX hydrolase [Xylanibacillus composti]MDT9727147.1 NUDIX domain-containing protein [Xylanibacillus composti]GIQ71411.1 DNA mismatch repair protein MutT [Xylanibacillus composti]